MKYRISVDNTAISSRIEPNAWVFGISKCSTVISTIDDRLWSCISGLCTLSYTYLHNQLNIAYLVKIKDKVIANIEIVTNIL